MEITNPSTSLDLLYTDKRLVLIALSRQHTWDVADEEVQSDAVDCALLMSGVEIPMCDKLDEFMSCDLASSPGTRVKVCPSLDIPRAWRSSDLEII